MMDCLKTDQEIIAIINELKSLSNLTAENEIVVTSCITKLENVLGDLTLSINNIWFKKYSNELREKQYIQAELSKKEDRLNNLKVFYARSCDFDMNS